MDDRLIYTLRITLILCQVLLFGILGNAQPTHNIQKSSGKIVVDGVLDEQVWTGKEVKGDFVVHQPIDTGKALSRTRVWMTYDDKFIYVAAECYDELDGKYVVQSLKRDFSYPKTDAFVVYLDPFNLQSNGYAFGVNPYGAQREGLVANSGRYGVTTAWDQAWFSEVRRYDDKWVVELAIPFKSIKYPPDLAQWRVNFSRNDLKRNVNSVWSAVPRNLNVASLLHTGILMWPQTPPKPGLNASFIPYLQGGARFDHEQNPKDIHDLGGAGMDIKMGIGTGLNLDLTLLPDFSQVEVDQQLIDLERFELFFPEQRKFFIENSDLFSGFGFSSNRPFFSRRIGLTNEILAGARLSGKLSKNWRIGVLDMVTRESETDTRENYLVGILQRQFGNGGTLGIIYENNFETNTLLDPDKHILGLEYNFFSRQSVWRGKAFVFNRFNTDVVVGGSKIVEGISQGAIVEHDGKRFFGKVEQEMIGAEYQTDMGFTPRNGFLRLKTYMEPKFYPKKGFIQSHGPAASIEYFLDHKELEMEERTIFAKYAFIFKNRSEFDATVYNKNIFLDRLFDPTGLGVEYLGPGWYEYNYMTASYISDFRKAFTYDIAVTLGEYYDGNRTGYSLEAGYRFTPNGSLFAVLEQNFISLPGSDVDRVLTLLGPKLEIAFNRKFYWTTFVQYNTQIDNFNINSRVQYRFLPMSDIYLVYTGNNSADWDEVKNRAFVAKIIWWMNS